MFLLDKVEKMRRIGTADEVEGPHLQRARKAIDDIDRLLASQGFFQEFARIIYSAGRNESRRPS